MVGAATCHLVFLSERANVEREGGGVYISNGEVQMRPGS